MQYTEKSPSGPNNLARKAWDAFLQEHPTFARLLGIVGSAIGYFLNGYALVDLVRWMVVRAGMVAESALMLGTLWVTLNYVAHAWIAKGLSVGIINALNNLSLISFSLLPELILAAAIKVTIEHWTLFFHHRSWKNPAWIWASLYTLPTSTFLVMTLSTLANFVAIEATTQNMATATGGALVARFIAGWGYSMVEILFNLVGKKGYVAIFDQLRATVAELRSTLATKDEELQALHENLAQSATQLEESSAKNATLQKAWEEQSALHAQEVEELRKEIALLKSRRVTRAVALSSHQSILPMTPHSTGSSFESAMYPAMGSTCENGSALEERYESATQSTGSSFENSYVAFEEGDSIALRDNAGATLIASGSEKERIKQALALAIQRGEKINLKVIAQQSHTGYSTVRKHAPTLITEITAASEQGH